MFIIPKHRKGSIEASKGKPLPRSAPIEILEPRMLLSAVVQDAIHPDIAYTVPAVTGPEPNDNQGYFPAQIRQAYGWNNATFGNGVAANGAGQTIAIVDANDDPGIESDLATFDSMYDIPAPPSFQVVGQDGSDNLPLTEDPDWDDEMSLDVEWSHAMAPGANIILVEVNDPDEAANPTPADISAFQADLVAGATYAATVPGVSVVSMSFGGSEFFTLNNVLEEFGPLYDADFTTPAGHQGVTFVASAGDSGYTALAQFPAASPNVLSVGGTSLSTSDQYGTYAGESAWSGSQSGVSQVEAEPAYQDAVQSTGSREVADVSYNADPETGFSIYVSDTGQDWFDVGGTSAGAPQWSALVAIADQGRTLEGLGTLDGPSQTIPMLYSVYGQPGTSAYSKYTSYFNDVTTGGASYTEFNWGGVGFSVASASLGYDPITGLGTPKVGAIVSLLDTPPAATIPAGPAGNGATSGSITFTGNETLPPSPLSASIPTVVPISAIGGQAGSIRLVLTDSTGLTFQGPVTVTLDASTNGAIDALVGNYSFSKIRLGSHRSVSELLKFDYPTGITANAYLIAYVSAVHTSTAVTDAVTSSSVAIGPPTVDLAASFSGIVPVEIDPGHNNTATITITNDGNVTASGLLNLALYASADAVLDASDTLLTSITGRRIKIGAHKSISIRVVFQSPDDLLGGTFNLISSISSTTSPLDTNTSNNIAVAATNPA